MQACQDKAQNTLSIMSGDSDKQRAQQVLESCVVDCAKEYTGQVPKIFASIKSNINKL